MGSAHPETWTVYTWFGAPPFWLSLEFFSLTCQLQWLPYSLYSGSSSLVRLWAFVWILVTSHGTDRPLWPKALTRQTSVFPSSKCWSTFPLQNLPAFSSSVALNSCFFKKYFVQNSYICARELVSQELLCHNWKQNHHTR